MQHLIWQKVCITGFPQPSPIFTAVQRHRKAWLLPICLHLSRSWRGRWSPWICGWFSENPACGANKSKLLGENTFLSIFFRFWPRLPIIFRFQVDMATASRSLIAPAHLDGSLKKWWVWVFCPIKVGKEEHSEASTASIHGATSSSWGRAAECVQRSGGGTLLQQKLWGLHHGMSRPLFLDCGC